MPGVGVSDSERAYTYAFGDLAAKLSKAARVGCFTAIIANPRSIRPTIVAIVAADEAFALMRRARMSSEDAKWHANAPSLAI